MTHSEMEAKIAQLEAENAALKFDTVFGIYNRNGLVYESQNTPSEYVIFCDLDNIHDANSRWGYETVNQKVRDALNIRSDDIVIGGRWFSGDELVFLVNGNPHKFIQRLQKRLQKNDMSATFAYTHNSGDLQSDVTITSDMVTAQKLTGIKGGLVAQQVNA